ncbi:hypothetical protein ABZ412_34340 [Nocardia sp. NPDC005746]|uniref:hypothetical protein n=1 Tax=Nocardia sp. NPDC005746 TaxID=3157062 RepID=UPI0033FD2BEA
MSTDHRAAALNALENAASTPYSDAIAYTSEAAAHALLYAGDQLAALVEQQKLQMLISAYVTAAVPLNDEERQAIRKHIKAALGLAGGA